MKHCSQNILFLLPIISFVLVAKVQGAEGQQFGPTGIFGNEAHKMISVTQVDAGSPAHGIIEPGMEIIGAGQAEFKTHVLRELAEAIDTADTTEGAGKLTLLLKGGLKVELTLEVLGRYSDTALYNCPKTEAILKHHVERQTNGTF